MNSTLRMRHLPAATLLLLSSTSLASLTERLASIRRSSSASRRAQGYPVHSHREAAQRPLGNATAGACVSTEPSTTACSRCRQASGGVCKPAFLWQWTATLAENDAKARLPGVRLVRGVAALSEPGVRVVSQWNQSNWPGIIGELAPGLVRAATPAARTKLCQLWHREHSYQSWPVLLRCPGWRPTEYEPPCGNVGAIVQIPCANIDLSSDPVTAGAVYDDTRWFRVTHSMHPPQVCNGRREVVVGDVGVALSVYPTALGHFVPEQLPMVLLLHANLPAHVPIIVADAPVVRRYLEPLVASGVALASRFRYQSLRPDGTVLRATSVYTVLNSHFSNVMNGDLGYRTLRAAYSPNGPLPAHRRTNIVLIDRGPGKSRSAINAAAVQAMLEAAAAAHVPRRARPGGSGDGDGGGNPLRVVNWRPNLKNVTMDIEVFRHASLIVAPHGAGLANMLFAAEGTPVIEVRARRRKFACARLPRPDCTPHARPAPSLELRAMSLEPSPPGIAQICYDDHFNSNSKGMFCPAMYAAMAANLHMPYWVVTGEGTYATPMKVDVPQLRDAVAQALETLLPSRSARHAASSAAGDEGGAFAIASSAASAADGLSPSALVRKLRRHTCQKAT